MTSYTVNDVLVKAIVKTYPAGEVIFARGVLSTLLIGGAALWLGHGPALRVPISWSLASRSLCDGLSTATFVAALAHMKLANIAAVLQIAPLIITALGVTLYGEVVGWRRWTAIGVGFVGALLVIKPIPSEFNIWALVAVAAALTASMREYQTRRIGRDLPVMVIAFWGTVGITLCGVPFVAVESWTLFAGADLLKLVIASVFVGVAIYLMARAFRDVDLSVVAPFRYIYLLTSALGGFLVFGEVPDSLTVAGAVLIMGGGIYALHREAVRRRDLTAKASTAL